MNAIRPPYTAGFNIYVRGDLGYKSDVEYYILGGGITAPWNWNDEQWLCRHEHPAEGCDG